MKILVCGDSYCVPDPKYPGLHWSEKLLDHSFDYELCNLAYGGCSNAMIALQLLQGLIINPQFVIMSFTSDGRYELDKDIDAIPRSLTASELANFQKKRFTTNMYDIDSVQKSAIDKWMTVARSDTFEKLKNYFLISFCLQTVEQKNIPFVFSLGGFEYKMDYMNLLNSSYVYNFIQQYSQHELKTNLWYFGQKSTPWFHVDDDNVQSLFASECIDKIDKVMMKR